MCREILTYLYVHREQVKAFIYIACKQEGQSWIFFFNLSFVPLRKTKPNHHEITFFFPKLLVSKCEQFFTRLQLKLTVKLLIRTIHFASSLRDGLYQLISAFQLSKCMDRCVHVCTLQQFNLFGINYVGKTLSQFSEQNTKIPSRSAPFLQVRVLGKGYGKVYWCAWSYFQCVGTVLKMFRIQRSFFIRFPLSQLEPSD